MLSLGISPLHVTRFEPRLDCSSTTHSGHSSKRKCSCSNAHLVDFRSWCVQSVGTVARLVKRWISVVDRRPGAPARRAERDGIARIAGPCHRVFPIWKIMGGQWCRPVARLIARGRRRVAYPSLGDELDAAILGSSCFGIIGGNRHGQAGARCCQAVCRDRVALRQRRHDALCAF